MIGAISEVFDEITKDLDIPIGTTQLITAMVGRGGSIGGVTRVASKNIIKMAIKKYRTNKVKEAYEKGDSQEIFKLRQKYSPSVMKKGEKEFRQNV